MKLKYSIFILLFSLLFTACSEDSVFHYLNKSDEQVTSIDTLPIIHRLLVHDDLNVQLISDTIFSIQITANKTLYEHINYEIINDSLILKNTNPYNWTSYNDSVYINFHVTQEFNRIETHGTGYVYCNDTVFFNKIVFYAFDGAGQFNILINTNNLTLVSHSFTTTGFNIYGITNSLRTRTRGMGKINCIGLEGQTAKIFHEGTNDCIINIKNELDVKIWSVGDVYYKGNPVITNQELKHKGQLIHID